MRVKLKGSNLGLGCSKKRGAGQQSVEDRGVLQSNEAYIAN